MRCAAVHCESRMGLDGEMTKHGGNVLADADKDTTLPSMDMHVFMMPV